MSKLRAIPERHRGFVEVENSEQKKGTLRMRNAKTKTQTRKAAEILYAAFLIAILAAVLAIIIQDFQVNTASDDVGWAISNGWHLLSQGWHYRLSTSWVVAHPYLSTGPEWLTDVIFYLTYAKTGWAGMVAIVQVLLGGALFWTYWRAKKSESNLTVFLAFVVFLEGMAGFLVDRPQIFTYLFLAFYLWWRSVRTGSASLSSGNRGMSRFLKSNWIWLIIMPLWASFHGGFALFYPLFLIDAVARKSYRSLWVIPVTMIEIALVMPNHFYNLIYPFLWQSVPYDQYIAEVAPIGFSGANMLNLTVLAFAGIVVWWRMKKVDRLILVLLGLFALHSMRNLPFYTIWVLWFLSDFRLGDYRSIKIPGMRELVVLDRESFMVARCFTNFAMPIAISALVVLIPFFQPNVHAFQNATVVDNVALRYVVRHANILDYLGYEPMQYSDELSLWGDSNYLESQQDVWAGIISPKIEPNLTMNAMKVATGELPVTKAWGYRKMRYILVRNGSVMDNEVKLMPSVWVPAFHDDHATVYVRQRNLR